MRFRQPFVKVQFSQNLSVVEVKCLVWHEETADLFLLADGDLYVTIGRQIGSDVMAQTWGCQAGHARSYCIQNHHQVLNVKTITTGLGQWSPTKDHSKWCVGKNINVVCIADMNRSLSQYKRYGGALCLNNQGVKNIFQSFVRAQESCNTQNIMNIQNTDCDTLDDWEVSVSKEGKLGFSMVSGGIQTFTVFSVLKATVNLASSSDDGRHNVFQWLYLCGLI